MASKALGDRFEEHRLSVIAKQDENEAQRNKIRAWKDGAFGKIMTVKAETPPAYESSSSLKKTPKETK